MKRIIISGCLAGVAIFIWGAIAHMALPLGHMGLKTLDDESAVIAGLKQRVTESGLYIYPGMDMEGDVSEAEQKEWEARYKAGPRGLLIYGIDGADPMSGDQLLTQLLTDVAAALIVACLLIQVGAAFKMTVINAGFIGLLVWLCVNVPYWNWYGFSGEFTIAQAIISVVGWLIGGVVIALAGKPKETTAPA